MSDQPENRDAAEAAQTEPTPDVPAPDHGGYALPPPENGGYAVPPPEYGGHPATQGGYPQSGYPQSGYPAQAGYPAEGGYPQAGYPQTGYPQTGYPQAGYPQSGYPEAGYPQAGYDQQYPGYHAGYDQDTAYRPAQNFGPPPDGGPSRSTQIALIAGGAVLALALGGGAAYALIIKKSPAPCSAAAVMSSGCTLPASAAPAPGSTDPDPGPTEPDPDPTVPDPDPAPTDPADALNLSSADAESVLSDAADENASKASSFVGQWVPQVSSKCAGTPADLEPGWLPDGQQDTDHVTIQQILAFNLSMSRNFDALTVRQTAVGIDDDQPSKGACKNRTVWMSIVPQGFASAAAANRWCDQNDPPRKECQARLVAGPGEDTKTIPR